MAIPIGILDSGVGGLTILRAIRESLPGHPLIYLADQAHVPYGSRQPDEVKQFATEIARFLLEQGAGLLVVACNTISVNAVKHLREDFPQVPFVGMEPAIKPAAANTRTGAVGVLATHATFHGEAYSEVVRRYAANIRLFEDPCIGLVDQIEKCDLEGPVTRAILEKALAPMLGGGIDTIVLGCTHYPFVIPLIQKIAGPSVKVIDPAPAVARQTRRLLLERGDLEDNARNAIMRLITTADAERLTGNLPTYLGFHHPVESARWKDGKLILQNADASSKGRG